MALFSPQWELDVRGILTRVTPSHSMALAVGKKRAGDNVAGAMAKGVMETRRNNESRSEKVEVFNSLSRGKLGHIVECSAIAVLWG